MLQRNIDEMAEGIETSKYILKDQTIQQNEDELDWYFIYKTKEELTTSESTPFDCFLCAGQPISASSSTEVEPDVDPSLTTNKYEYIFDTQNPGGTIRIHCPVKGYNTVAQDTDFRNITLGKPMIVVITVRDGLLNVGVKFFKMLLTGLCIYRTENNTRVYFQFGDYTEYGQDVDYGNTGVFHE